METYKCRCYINSVEKRKEIWCKKKGHHRISDVSLNSLYESLTVRIVGGKRSSFDNLQVLDRDIHFFRN